MKVKERSIYKLHYSFFVTMVSLRTGPAAMLWN